MDRKPLSFAKLIIYLLLAFLIAAFGIYFGYAKGWIPGLAAWLAGILFWTLAEYLIHRFLFHPWGTLKKYKLLPPLLITHGRHHRLPEEMATGFLHPLLGIPLVLLIGALFYLLLQGHVFFFLPGFIMGYAGYMLIHYGIHRRRVPFSWMEPLWQHHFLHHFQYPDKCFGVTTLFWDRLFGTFKKGNKT